MSREKNDFKLNVGTSSILFIFVVLCLVSFATLSLSSAVSDYKMSKKVADNTKAYYEACNVAEEKLADMQDSLQNLYATGISRAGYFEQVGQKKNFAIPVNDLQTLQVEISILYPDSEGEPCLRVEKWCTELTGSLEYDESLPVFK